MKENISPEERLLRLIKNQNTQTEPSVDLAIKSQAAVHQPAALAKGSQITALRPVENKLEVAGKIIIPVFVVSCIFLVISFVYPLFKIKQERFSEMPSGKQAELKTEPLAEAKPYEFYAQGITSRSIFSAISAPTEEKEQAAANIDSEKLFGELNLVGVISGDNPQAIIEDKKTRKTYYINKGQSVGEFQAEDIQEGKVTLNYNGQKFELYL